MTAQVGFLFQMKVIFGCRQVGLPAVLEIAVEAAGLALCCYSLVLI